MKQNMTRRGFLGVAGALGAATTLPGSLASAEPKSKRNIVLVMIDDMGYECIGTYGSTYKTPVLDRAATEGVKFNHCYSTPLCTPSRVEIMTGKYNNRNYTKFGCLDPAQKTFGNIFRDAGYATCIAGKWQLSGSNKTIDEFGFDEHCVWNMLRYDKAKSNKSKDNSKRERYWAAALYKNGEWLPRKKEEYGPDLCADFMTEFMEKNQKKPFFIYYPAILVHNPFPVTPDSKNSSNTFADMCTYTDKIVGRLEAKLKELGLFENTVIIFTGDNGTNKSITTPMKDGTKIRGNKGEMTDGGTRVPLIVWGAGVKSGIESDSLIDFSDFLPTVTDLAGIEVPEGFKCDGTSFKPVLDGEKKEIRESIFCYYEPKWGKWKKQVWARNKEYKLYASGKFYHIPSDVLEEKPLSDSDLDDTAKKAKTMLKQTIEKFTK